MSAIESTINPSGSPNPRSATRNGGSVDVFGGRPSIARTSSAQTNLAPQIDQPRNSRRRTRHTPDMRDARNLAKLIERQTVHFRAKIEAQVRNAFLLRRQLGVGFALLFDRGEEGFRIHG